MGCKSCGRKLKKKQRAISLDTELEVYLKLFAKKRKTSFSSLCNIILGEFVILSKKYETTTKSKKEQQE